jgi:hypothetical protein
MELWSNLMTTAVIVNKKKSSRHTCFGPIARELRDKNFTKNCLISTWSCLNIFLVILDSTKIILSSFRSDWTSSQLLLLVPSYTPHIPPKGVNKGWGRTTSLLFLLRGGYRGGKQRLRGIKYMCIGV